MKPAFFSLIVCTYKRSEPLRKLLESVERQTLYPDEILIVDSSPDFDTSEMIESGNFKHLHYFKVGDADRGLTRQRNYGISKVGESARFVCFLDDDIILEPDYFEQLIATYELFPQAIGVGGYIINEGDWTQGETADSINEFAFDGWKRTDPSRFVLRKKLGLDSDLPPGFSPGFSHGRSVGFLPPSGKIYETQQLMGGVSSFRKTVFDAVVFSTYFEGYGLYEDADFTIRVSKNGKLFVNTAARVSHYHNFSGRPNWFDYGKMVVRNGWYVWRIGNQNPTAKDRFKWHGITILLTFIRYCNIFTTADKKAALTEAFGRTAGWFSLFLKQPGK